MNKPQVVSISRLLLLEKPFPLLIRLRKGKRSNNSLLIRPKASIKQRELCPRKHPRVKTQTTPLALTVPRVIPRPDMSNVLEPSISNTNHTSKRPKKLHKSKEALKVKRQQSARQITLLPLTAKYHSMVSPPAVKSLTLSKLPLSRRLPFPYPQQRKSLHLLIPPKPPSAHPKNTIITKNKVHLFTRMNLLLRKRHNLSPILGKTCAV